MADLHCSQPYELDHYMRPRGGLTTLFSGQYLPGLEPHSDCALYSRLWPSQHPWITYLETLRVATTANQLIQRGSRLMNLATAWSK